MFLEAVSLVTWRIPQCVRASIDSSDRPTQSHSRRQGTTGVGIANLGGRCFEQQYRLGADPQGRARSAGVGGGGIYNEGANVACATRTVSSNSATITSPFLRAVASTRTRPQASLPSSSTSRSPTITTVRQSAVDCSSNSQIDVFNSTIAANGVRTAAERHGGQYQLPGGNNDNDNSCGFNRADDVPGVNPLLGPLKNNGGPTRTHLPSPGSPLLDKGRQVVCDNQTDAFGSPDATDQRGQPRTLGGDMVAGKRCDIGAVEYMGPSCFGRVPNVVGTNGPNTGSGARGRTLFPFSTATTASTASAATTVSAAAMARIPSTAATVTTASTAAEAATTR